MSQPLQPPALLVYFPDEDPGNQDAAVLLVLGEGAPVLAERFSDFVLSLPGSNWAQQIGRLAVLPLNKEALTSYSRRIPCIIAISGALTDKDIRLAAQLVQLGGHCTVVVDATTAIRPEWTSVIRLPPHRSRDAQWAWGMRVYLDAMLNRGLICLDAFAIQACTQNRFSQFTMVHAHGERRAIVGVERAVQSLAKRCDLRACDTFLLLFHSGRDVRIKELHWGIRAFRNAVGGLGCVDYLINVGHLPARDDEFVVSFLAGAIREKLRQQSS